MRKTYPKLPTPFICYIYCTKERGCANGGKIIGEFVCDLIGLHPGICVPSSCVPMEELERYANGQMLARWHISDLKIYGKPKELGNFWKADKCPYATESGCTYKYHCFRAGQTQRCGETLTRPPQSWCYVDAERVLQKE